MVVFIVKLLNCVLEELLQVVSLELEGWRDQVFVDGEFSRMKVDVFDDLKAEELRFSRFLLDALQNVLLEVFVVAQEVIDSFIRV